MSEYDDDPTGYPRTRDRVVIAIIVIIVVAAAIGLAAFVRVGG